jgi:predicted nucleotidyltransferase
MPADGALPEPHARFLERARERLEGDTRIVGVAAGGSYVAGMVDEFSDLDLVVAVEPASYERVLADAEAIAGGIAPLLAAFVGEHVYEPRLLICLYGPPLLHVDLKFVRVQDLADRVEDPVVLWERDGRVTAALANGVASFPAPDLDWVEKRFWSWVHYIAAKIGRGELLQAVDSMELLRSLALGPLVLVRYGARPSGVRRLETVAPHLAPQFAATIAAYDARSCTVALHAAIALYRQLRIELATPAFRPNAAAEEAAMAYLRDIEARL